MDYVLVGIGGILGSLTRYSLGKTFFKNFKRFFPLATFTINITGAFLLGMVSALNISGNNKLLIADGFLGAYTTFSTFMYEGFILFKQNRTLNALIYISGSMVTGILCFLLGFSIVNM